MLNFIHVLPFVVATITSVGSVYLRTFLYRFISSEVLVCLGVKGCAARALTPEETWDVPLLIVNMQTQGLRNKSRVRIGPRFWEISFSPS